MLTETPTIAQLATIISQIAAPAFLLGAEAELLAVLVSRMDRTVDRSRAIAAIPDDDDERRHLKAELPSLRRRVGLLHRAILWSVASGVVTGLLVIVAFAMAFLNARHEYGAAGLFIVALGLFTAALISFAREVHLGLTEFDYLGW